MNLMETTYCVVGSSFALYIWIAIRSRAGTTQEFYVAGKGIHPVANGMATAADWMSAASFISMAGLIGLSYNGYGGSVFLMGWTGGYVILAMLIALTYESTVSSRCQSLSVIGITPTQQGWWQ